MNKSFRFSFRRVLRCGCAKGMMIVGSLSCDMKRIPHNYSEDMDHIPKLWFSSARTSYMHIFGL